MDVCFTFGLVVSFFLRSEVQKRQKTGQRGSMAHQFATPNHLGIDGEEGDGTKRRLNGCGF